MIIYNSKIYKLFELHYDNSINMFKINENENNYLIDKNNYLYVNCGYLNGQNIIEYDICKFPLNFIIRVDSIDNNVIINLLIRYIYCNFDKKRKIIDYYTKDNSIYKCISLLILLPYDLSNDNVYKCISTIDKLYNNSLLDKVYNIQDIDYISKNKLQQINEYEKQIKKVETEIIDLNKERENLLLNFDKLNIDFDIKYPF